MSNRQERVAEEIKKVVSEALRTKVDNPDIGMVTVTDVELTKEMETATLYYTSLNDNKDEVANALEKSKGLIRSEVAREIRIRKAPELAVKYDNSIEYGTKVESLLNEITEQEACCVSPRAFIGTYGGDGMLHGVIPINKAQGMTGHDVVFKMRK